MAVQQEGRDKEGGERSSRQPAELRTDVEFVSMSLLAPSPGLRESTAGISSSFSSASFAFSPLFSAESKAHRHDHRRRIAEIVFANNQ